HGHASFTYLAPYVFRVALSNSRIVGLTDRTVTFTYRKVGSARPRTSHLDVLEFIRRFLQHVLPHGFMKVRHFGFLHASCAIPPATIRLMIGQAHPLDDPLPPRPPPATARGPLSDLWRTDARHPASMDLSQRLCRYRLKGITGPDACGATRCGQPTAPVRPYLGIREHQAAHAGSATTFSRPVDTSRSSADALLVISHTI